MTALKTRSGLPKLLGLLSALGLVAALTMPALANHDPADGPEVVPTAEEFPGGDPTCEVGVAVRFNNPAAGNDEDVDLGGGQTATVTILSVANNQLTFEVENGVAAVVTVKGGVSSPGTDDQNVYDYSGLAGGGVAHDDGLTVPSGQGISHVDFCVVVPTATPTPTPTESEAEATPTPTPTASPTPTGEVSEGTPTPSPTERGGVAGGNPTATPAPVPDTAVSFDGGAVPAMLLSLLLIGSLAAMAYLRLARER